MGKAKRAHRVGDGFSLIELLFVLAIIAIISAISFPSFETFFTQSKEKILSEKLLRSIHLARSEAVSRHAVVLLSKSGEWKNGFIISTSGQVLDVFQNEPIEGDLHWRSFPLDRDHLEFLASGFPRAENGTFWYCARSAKNPVWAIMMSQSGRARLVWRDQSGQILDDKERVIVC